MSSSLEVDSDKVFTGEWTTSIQTHSQQLSNLQSNIFITQRSPGGFTYTYSVTFVTACPFHAI